MQPNKAKFGLDYVETGSFLHRLSGVTKFILFIFWISLTLGSFDLRIIAFMLLTGFLLLRLSRVPFRVYRPFVFLMLYIVLVNAVFIFLFSPLQGVEYMGSRRDLLVITPRYTVTLETLFYLTVVTAKLYTIFPMALLFVFTTHPTEFAASLNKIGVSYKVAYAVSLTLRYLPEITKDFVNIIHSQQARGVDISKKVSLSRRIKNVSSVLIPLILSSLDKAEVISNAMTLRGFGKQKKRTWYNARSLGKLDLMVFLFMILLFSSYLYLRAGVEGMFWYPF